jgi:hypothetical protein
VQTTTGIAGVAITAGQLLYLDSTATPPNMKLADANLSLAAATVLGVALHAASIGQPILYQTAGDINMGAVLIVGGVYVLSATDAAGAFALVADLAAGWYPTVVGIAWSASILTLAMAKQSTPTVHA